MILVPAMSNTDKRVLKPIFKSNDAITSPRTTPKAKNFVLGGLKS